MKYQILLITLIITIFTCACERENFKSIIINEKTVDNKIEKKIEKATNETPNKSPSNSSSKELKKQITSTPSITEIYKTEVTIEQEKPNEENSIDELSPDYLIHQGRIDCIDETACQDLSLPMQFKYHELIPNVFYLEVLAKNYQVLGYFIQYVFGEHQYETNEDCNNVGNNIKNDLNDKITAYQCTDENILKLVTNY